MPYGGTGDDPAQCIKLTNSTQGLERRGEWVRHQRTIMRASPDTHLLSYLNLTLILFSAFCALSSSSSSFCDLQEQVPRYKSFHKAGDFVLGGLLPMHEQGLYYEDFTTKQPDPNCWE